MFHVGEELAKGGATKGSLRGTIESGTGTTADAASSSPAVANDKDADRPAATVGKTDTLSANPEKRPDARPSSSAECARDRASREAPTETVPARYEPVSTGALQPASDGANGSNLEEAFGMEERRSAAAVLTAVEYGKSAGIGGNDNAGGVPIETRQALTNQELGLAAAAEAAGVEGTNAPPQVCAESWSGSGVGESSGGRPESAGDLIGNTRKRESRAELGRARSASKVSRKTSKRSVSAMSRRSGGGGGGGGGVEPPANTPHLQV